MELLTDHLARTWYGLFGDTPGDDIIKTFANYAERSEDNSDRFFEALFSSTMVHFRTEYARCVWIADRLAGTTAPNELTERLRAA
jgi:hypothetical protein